MAKWDTVEVHLSQHRTSQFLFTVGYMNSYLRLYYPNYAREYFQLFSFNAYPEVVVFCPSWYIIWHSFREKYCQKQRLSERQPLLSRLVAAVGWGCKRFSVIRTHRLPGTFCRANELVPYFIFSVTFFVIDFVMLPTSDLLKDEFLRFCTVIW